MKSRLQLLVTITGLVLCVLTASAAETNAPSADVEAKYTRDIEGRAAAILALLTLENAGESNRVRDAILTQYRTLRSWHDTNDATIKQLTKLSNSQDQAAASAAREQLASIKASLKTVHNGFIAQLAADLTPSDVEKVKDKMTYNKVQVTYDTYCKIVPTLTDEQKAKILDWLKEAREEAMDAGSSNEKSDIFNKYKGRINNYLSKQGIDMGKASREFNEKTKAASRTNSPASAN